ncbi:MAG TPA: hypothetical protein VN729_10780 [Ktedonobacteraceae bacterium]|nr:hypothetical protein [Ktedonobacteraceae bacterium]
MTEEREHFSPERVDEQIDQLSQNESHPKFSRWQQTRSTSQAEQRLVKDLQGYYQTEQQQDIASLERAWKRVSPHLAASTEHPRSLDNPLSSDKLRISQERTRSMYNQAPERSRERKALRWPGMLAAILVTAVLVGGLVMVLNLNHRTSLTGSSRVSTSTALPTPTPTSQPPGTTVYTTPAEQGSYTNFSWSPDSKRVAVLGGNGAGNVHIWDATTGGNAVIVTIPGQNEWAWGLAWSPVNQDIAIGTNQHLLIADGQTGAILHTYTSSAATTGSPGSPYLSSLIPASGGYGYRALGWSPDGKYLAASISFGASGSLQVWNMQTGSVSYTLSLGSDYVIGSLAWTSDGKYLAAHGYNTQGPDPNVASDIVAVWDATTHHKVFNKLFMMDGSDAPVYWQPQTHNLAFMAFSNQYLTLEIWDVLTGHELHKYVGKGSDAMAFSPDGKQVAYDSSIGSGKSLAGVISIMDLSSGAHVYTYKGSDGALAWSPNGKYIVSNSGGQMILGKNGQPVIKNGQMQTTPSYAKVWIAQQ